MATNLPTENVEHDTMSHFDRVISQIERTFNQLIEQLIGRKEDLLRKVLQLREEFHNKESARREAIRELKKTQKFLRHLNLKANLNIPIHQQASQAYEQGMEQLTTPTKLPSLSFSCPTRDILGELIDSVGEVSEKVNKVERIIRSPSVLLDKKEPILTACKRGRGVGEFNYARGIALDKANQRAYIADMGNSRIQVFSFQGEFISTFGDGVLEKPSGITETKDQIFITDVSLHSLLCYDKKTLQLIEIIGGEGKEKGKLYFPRGLAVDTNGDIYIADCDNHRVSIFSKKVKFISCIGRRILHFPQDIKLKTESVVVLDWSDKCVHFFTRNGDLLSSCVTQGCNCLVFQPSFFCLNKDSNIFISDRMRHNIKIVSRSGELIHTLGGKGFGRGEFENPFGIAVSISGTVYVVSDNPYYILQAF